MKKTTLIGLLSSLMTPMAWAHPGHDAHITWLSGLVHPLTGWDHVLVLCAVGLWSARACDTQTWRLPLLFLATMCLGSLFAVSAADTHWAETLVLLSVLLFGVMLFRPLKMGMSLPSVVFVCMALGMVAFAHGYLHGVELASHLPALLSMGLTSALVLAASWAIGRSQATWIKPLANTLGASMLIAGIWSLWMG